MLTSTANSMTASYDSVFEKKVFCTRGHQIAAFSVVNKLNIVATCQLYFMIHTIQLDTLKYGKINQNKLTNRNRNTGTLKSGPAWHSKDFFFFLFT